MKAIDDGFKEMIEMTKIEKLEATVKELAETVKHTVDEQSALCMRVNLLEEGSPIDSADQLRRLAKFKVNLLEEGGQIISPIYNGQYAVLGRDEKGYIVSIFVNKSGLCEYAPCDGDDLHSEHCTTMLDAMQEYQKCLNKIRSGPPHRDEDDINNSSDLAIAVANDELSVPCLDDGVTPVDEVPEPAITARQMTARFKIYGDEYPEIWAHFMGKDYNPKFEEELVVRFHNHRESRDH